MSKDEWIQKAKALLFDLTFMDVGDQQRQEAADLIEKGGGFDHETETDSTPLNWPEEAA